MKLSEQQKANLIARGIPDYMHGGIIRYYENGIPPGGFLSAVINNDLQGAFGRADDTNSRCIRNYIMWFYNDAPAGTWGYPNAVEDWCERFQEEQTKVQAE